MGYNSRHLTSIPIVEQNGIGMRVHDTTGGGCVDRKRATRMRTGIVAIIAVFCTLLGANILFAATDLWTQKADFGGTGRDAAVGFSIGGKGYVGTGNNGSTGKDFWEYDPITDCWTQKAYFAGTGRLGAVGFSIGGKGYIGTGHDSSTLDRKDFWEYDPALNTWTQKADFGGPEREFAIGFSIGSKGYVGMGGGWSPPYYYYSAYQDFWEYDPALDTWTRKADYGGGPTGGGVGFSIGGKGYAGTGVGFWEYDPALDSWTRKADFTGGTRSGAVGFSIEGKGYVGTGRDSSMNNTNDFREYDPTADTWVRKADFGGLGRAWSVGFSIGSKGYVGTSDFWEYDPSYLYLSQGWNFVSTPIQPLNTDIASALSDISPNLNIVWAWDAATQRWLKYCPSQSGKLGAAVVAVRPVRSTADRDDRPHVPLVRRSRLDNWNLGCGQDNTTLANGLQSLSGKWKILWEWNAGIWSGHDERIADSNLPAGISPLTRLNQWRAYWIRIKPGQAGNWVQ